MEKEKETSVQVAVRIRPQNAREQVDLCRVCTFVTPGEPQVVLGKDKAFTYDHVYDVGSEQQEIYNGCIERLVEGCFNGFNATVLAYGQTGSGKTYTMGTGFDITILPEEQGMIPRAVRHLFNGITKRVEEAKANGLTPPNFNVTAQFLELYNEEIIDLFDSSRENSKRLKIHENSSGNIYVDGAVTQHVQSEVETMEALKRGAVSRTVGSTNMNAQSSRSHAIFTILVKQEKPVINNDEGSISSDFEMLTAKFHFVDLAGSERLKRTGATGDRAKEGISINCGLLALGNVISALGDQVKKGSHVPYRDSKLTRLLQDSLGGNSRTLMIACISPSDRDFMETLNTLKYANRARNIKNKVSVNQDKASAQLNVLRKRIAELENELTEFKAGRIVVANDGSVVLNDLANENAMLKTENDKLRSRIKSMQGLIDFQKEKLSSLQADCDIRNLEQHDESTGQVINVNSEDSRVKELLQQYLHQIEDLRAQLVLYESGKENARPFTGSSQRTLTSIAPFHSHPSATDTAASVPVKMETDQVLQVAKKDIDRLQNEYSQKRLQRSARTRRSRRRRRQMFMLPANERRSTDVEDWVMKCINSESDVMATEGSDTEINEDDILINDDCVVVNDIESSDDDDSSSSISSDSSQLSEEEEEGEEVREEELDDDDDGDKISIATSIAELSTEINIKQQLVEQLEKAQKSLNQLRTQYEDKMMLLQTQIKATEVERDQCIKDITNRRTEHEEAVIKEVKEKYEKQLRDMKTELKQLEKARKEHAKALQKNAQQFTELQKVKGDLSDMKRQKIKLLRQLKEETSVMKKKEQKREKELAMLKREHKRKESVIKTLQADAKRKEIIIRKRNEEVTALRRMQQQANQAAPAKAAAVTTRKTKPSSVSLSKEDEPVAKKAKLRKRPHSAFISDSAKKKWKAMEKKMEEIVSRTQMINSFETDMEHWVKKRNELSQRALELQQQKEDLLQATEDKEYLKNLDEELEGVCAQIAWANDCIENLQDDVVNYEDVRTETSTSDAIALIHTCSTREAKFLLEKIVNVFIELSINYYQKVGEVKSLNTRLQTSEQHAELIKIFSSPLAPQSPLVVNSRTASKIATTSLQHRVLQPPPKINLQVDCEGKESGNCDTNCLNTSDSSSIELSPSISRKPIKFERKLRRRTGLPNELAHHRRQLSDPPPLEGHLDCTFLVDQSDNDDGVSTRRRRHSEDQIGCSPRRQLSYKKNRSVSQITESLEVPTVGDCPGSPSSSGTRSLRHGDSTLSLKSAQENNDIIKGRIEAERLVPTKLSKPLHCTHVAKGHSAGILSMSVTDTMLLSASQDCTVKVWDLSHGQEVSVLNRHHSYVRKVVHDPESGLVFTACQGLIKLWDLRDLRNAQFVKTLSPSSQQGPAHLNSADTVVQDLLVTNDVLFSASGNVVNVWDLRQMNTIGRLVGHTGTVGTMTNIVGGFIATGSRDRLIKLYDVSDVSNSEMGFNQISQVTLAPAHYDTVSSLSSHEDMMFSACGVSIKQWDIPKRCLVQTLDGAHPQAKNNAITSLIPFPPLLLVSACKSGILKLWRLNSDCQAFGEVSAHKSSINCISSNATTLFTGSSDKTIKLWKPNTSSLSVP